eukprot:gene3361-biopygen8189
MKRNCGKPAEIRRKMYVVAPALRSTPERAPSLGGAPGTRDRRETDARPRRFLLVGDCVVYVPPPWETYLEQWRTRGGWVVTAVGRR